MTKKLIVEILGISTHKTFFYHKIHKLELETFFHGLEIKSSKIIKELFHNTLKDI